MHTENLETLRKEAFRLIQLEENLLNEIKSVPGLIGNSQAESSDSNVTLKEQSFTENALTRSLEVLSGERNKLEEMDMVVAVVGTMKAGKSTTINAIVGAEVLPNRNGAMTSIPTLIRHVAGKTTPEIIFTNNEPLNALCRQLQKAMSKKPEKTERAREESPDMANVIEFVQSGEAVQSRYTGQPGIFKLLKEVNDIVRLCSSLNVAFPFSDYDEIHELPVIEVEFSTLIGQEKALGNLILLDTPGPNEAGQHHLKEMLRDQLRKASAVIAVLNYTQLNSDSDEELRNEISDIASFAEGRLYAFVNRIDERGHNDPDISTIIQIVSKLLPESIPLDRIYPVSAQKAFLGEVVQTFIQEEGQLPNPQAHPWFVQFAEGFYGRRWERATQDPEQVLKDAREYWEESHFSDPLKRVIHAAHENAAYYALDSTASKLVEYSERISDFVEIRSTALKKSADELRSYIETLKKDKNDINQLREKYSDKTDALIKKLRKEIRQEIRKTIKAAKRTVETLFTEGVTRQIKEEQDVKGLSAKQRTDSVDRVQKSTYSERKKRTLLDSFVPKTNRKSPRDDKVLDIEKRDLEFTDRSEAVEFISNIEKALRPVIRTLNKALGNAFQRSVNVFQEDIRHEVVKSAEESLNMLRNRFQKEGFSLHFSMPSELQGVNLRFGSLSMKKSISNETKKVRRLKEQTGFLGSVKRLGGRLLDNDWGYDERHEEIQVFRLSLDSLKTNTQEVIEEQGKRWSDEIKNEVEKPIEDTLELFFDQLQGSVEAVREDLLQSIRDKEKSKSEQDALLKGLKRLAKHTPTITQDSKDLKSDAQSEVSERMK